MPYFQYKGRSTRGALVSGAIEAGTMDSAASQLLNSGITPIDITESKKAGDGFNLQQILRGSQTPGLTELSLFSRQMYTLMKSGVPMLRTINGLIQSTRNLQLVNALKDILANLESGQDLATSMSRHSNIFSTLFINMVRVGENTGQLDMAFMRISEYLEREKEARERIKAAIRYPLIVMVAISIAIAIVNIYVIPAFAGIFEKANVALPWQTRILLATSDFFVNYWYILLGGVVLAIVGFMNYIRTENGRYRWDRAKLKFPLVGDIIHRATMARFARAFSMSLTAGVPLIQALTVVARAIDNEFIGEHILNMRNGIQRGESLTRIATITNMFTPIVLQMLAVGEETGAVDDMLTEVAEFYEREVDYDLKNLSAAIEPVMTIAVGILVLILGLGILLPLWDLGSAVT